MITEQNTNPIQSLITQKRELFRTNIRKTKQDNFFNIKRFFEFNTEIHESNDFHQKNAEKFEIESDFLPTTNQKEEEKLFSNELLTLFSNIDTSLPYSPIISLKNIIKKTTFFIEKRNWFDENSIKFLLSYLFKNCEFFDIFLLHEFCNFLEKIFICCSFYSDTLISMNIIEFLKNLLQKNRQNLELTESVFFCFAHLSSEGKNLDSFMKNDIILEILLTLMIREKTPLILTKLISWLIYNITTIPKDFSVKNYHLAKFLFTICGQMIRLKDKEIITCNLSSIFSIISEESDKLDDFCFNKEHLIDEKIHILELVNTCLFNEDEDIKAGALKIVYKVSLGNEKQTAFLIEKKIVDSLIILLDRTINKEQLLNKEEQLMNKEEKIAEILNKELLIRMDVFKQQILLVLGNILEENKENVEYCLERGLYAKIIRIFFGDSVFSLKKECVFCLLHSTYNCDAKQITFLLNQARILEIFCRALDLSLEIEIVNAVLSGILNILEFGEFEKNNENENNVENEEKINDGLIDKKLIFNYCLRRFDEENFGERLESLINHQDEMISKKAMNISNLLFNEEF